MKVVKDRVIFKFTKDDIMALKQLKDKIFEEFEGYGTTAFNTLIRDIMTEDPKKRVYDLTKFDTFSIEIEE